MNCVEQEQNLIFLSQSQHPQQDFYLIVLKLYKISVLWVQLLQLLDGKTKRIFLMIKHRLKLKAVSAGLRWSKNLKEEPTMLLKIGLKSVDEILFVSFCLQASG